MTGLKKLEVLKTATKLHIQSITRNTLGETVGRMFGMTIEIFQEAGDIETLADIIETIPVITTTHMDEIQSKDIRDTGSPSTDDMIWIGGSTGTLRRTSTDTVQTMVSSTDTDIKHHIQVGIISTVLCRIIIQGIRI